jgi:spore germination protein GerM
MTSRRILAMCMLALAAGCGVPAQDQAERARDEAVPFALLDPAAPPIFPSPSGSSSEPVALCFVRDGRLVIVSKEVGAPADLGAALDALASPPPDAGPLLRTALTEPSVVREVRLLGGIARVDLLPEVSALPADEQLLAVAQIVCTLTGRPGVGQVAFTLQGARLAVPKGDGSLVSSPVARDDYAGLLT